MFSVSFLSSSAPLAHSPHFVDFCAFLIGAGVDCINSFDEFHSRLGSSMAFVAWGFVGQRQRWRWQSEAEGSESGRGRLVWVLSLTGGWLTVIWVF